MTTFWDCSRKWAGTTMRNNKWLPWGHPVTSCSNINSTLTWEIKLIPTRCTITKTWLSWTREWTTTCESLRTTPCRNFVTPFCQSWSLKRERWLREFGRPSEVNRWRTFSADLLKAATHNHNNQLPRRIWSSAFPNSTQTCTSMMSKSL